MCWYHHDYNNCTAFHVMRINLNLQNLMAGAGGSIQHGVHIYKCHTDILEALALVGEGET